MVCEIWMKNWWICIPILECKYIQYSSMGLVYLLNSFNTVPLITSPQTPITLRSVFANSLHRPQAHTNSTLYSNTSLWSGLPMILLTCPHFTALLYFKVGSGSYESGYTNNSILYGKYASHTQLKWLCHIWLGTHLWYHVPYHTAPLTMCGEWLPRWACTCISTVHAC